MENYSNVKITTINKNLMYPNHNHNKKNNLSKLEKRIIGLSSLAGTSAVVGLMAKKNGYSLNPKRILNTPLKDLAIFKSKESGNTKPLKFEEKEIIAMATSSVAGGFISGSILDKKHIKEKTQESITQVLGNVLIPVFCVGQCAKFYKKHKNNIINKLPKIKKDFISKPVTKLLNSIIKNLPNAIITIGSLTLGILTGNKVSNFINENIYHKKIYRQIEVGDFAPHVDDVCMAISMTNSENSFGSSLSRVIPLALTVPGYKTGIAR